MVAATYANQAEVSFRRIRRGAGARATDFENSKQTIPRGRCTYACVCMRTTGSESSVACWY